MPTLKSKLKDALNKALQDANECMLRFPEERSAHNYASSIHELIKVCEDRKRY